MSKKYKILWDDAVVSDLKAIDKFTVSKIINKIEDYLCLDPINLGKPLRCNLKGLYRYRFGDYRIIYEIKESELLMLVIRVAHRKEVYDKNI